MLDKIYNNRGISKPNVIRLTEADLKNIITKSVTKYILSESQESKSIDAAKKLAMQHGFSYEEADKLVRHDIRHDFPFFSRNKRGNKFILGVTRMFLDKQIKDAQTMNNLNTTLKYVASDAHYNEYDRNLNGMSAQDLIQRFAKNVEMDLENDRNEVNSMEFTDNSNYKIVRIDSFEQACEYNKYTYKNSPWCLTYDEGNYDSYTCNGVNQLYFCLRKGFENVEPIPSEGCPLDEYGLSMISVIVNENGALAYCTSRWNHANGGNDSIMDTKQISEVVGQNFYEVFKPNTKWKDMVENALQRLRNGERPMDIFDETRPLRGFISVELSGKWNWVDKKSNSLVSPKQWFDWVGSFDYSDTAWLSLNNRHNLIDTQGNLLFPNQWFDYFDEISHYFSVVGVYVSRVPTVMKYNFVNKKDKKLVYNKPVEQWFDDFIDNTNTSEYSEVKLDGKWYLVDLECNFYDEEREKLDNFNMDTQNESVMNTFINMIVEKVIHRMRAQML